ncbi:MAG: FimB/Mfa2 family fimbrial subunit [Paludibacteraceae bacterium]|nr:FimB/Mfa2 family fimbrial subunit [Paludibacteraceae bacterium]
MKKLCRHIVWVVLCVIGMQSCSMIDDDLSVCGTDFELALQMQLITNLDLELETVLSAQTDIHTRAILHDYFSDVFTDHAHDISIDFYNTENDELVYTIHDTIDANQSTYTFYLPKNDYHAIALANLDGNGVVSIRDSANSRMACLVTQGRDTLPTQKTGLFAVSRDVTVIDTADQKIDLTLHMANSAVALAIDTGNVHVLDMWAILCNTADGLVLRDSLYTFNHPKTILMERITESATAKGQRSKVKGQRTMSGTQDSDTIYHRIFGCVAFPSPDESDGYGTYYQVKVYVMKTDDTITETVLSVRESLPAGHLKVLKLQLQDDGQVVPLGSPDVGASVTLDWKEGTEYNPVI